MTSPFDSSSSESPFSKPLAGAEMRTSVRKAVSLKVRLLLDGGLILDGRTKDLSTGGIGLLLQRPLAPQSVVQVALQLPKLQGPEQPGGHLQYDVVTGSGKVVFQVLSGDSHHIGLQWLNLDSKMMSVLEAFFERITKPPAIKF